jgi:hypothetical protein
MSVQIVIGSDVVVGMLLKLSVCNKHNIIINTRLHLPITTIELN